LPLLRLLFVLVLAVIASAQTVRAQAEIVPSEHPVYDFLHHQRVRGLLPEYRHEWRPLDRGRIAALLDLVATRSAARGKAPITPWHRYFSDEITEPPGAVEAVYEPGRPLALPLGRDTKKYLLYYRDEDWRVALTAAGRAQVRLVSESHERRRGLAFVPIGTLAGNYRGWAGFYTSTFNGIWLGGDTRVLQEDPLLAPLYYVSWQDVPPGSFDRSTVSTRIANQTFSAEIGHARLVAGASFGDPLVLAENSDYFSYVRLGLETRGVQYAFLHGALGDRSRQIIGDGGGEVLLGPQRYLAMHRLTVNPWHWLQLAFTEAVVYGMRGPELAYLNPFYPIKPAEHALWDRDNAMFTLDAVVRPVVGLEAYGTVFVADLDTRLLGQGSYNNKWAVQAGIGGALGPVLSWIEYTRIEPFVYTHRFELDGSFYNSYVHNGFGLGHPIGPNADQWALGVRGWLPGRVRGEVVGRYVRRGENYVDPETGELVNVGGDVRDGRQPPFSELTKQFLGGDRFEGPGVRTRVSWEPIRDIGLALMADYQRWDRDPDRLFVRAEIFVGL
jgi:hypothetical protein